MGGATYCYTAAVNDTTGVREYSRSASRATANAMFLSKGVDEIFTQQRERRAHDTMLPKNAKMREARDSEAHPNSFPVILTLDVTGSMRRIPHDLIKTGLPTMMGGLVEKGANDVSLLFLAVGDHISDRCPLQVGQFESGDSELDMWLTRTYLEGGGGGGYSESYHLAWEFAADHTQSDAWDKRNQKGLLFTIGDEFVHPDMPKSVREQLYDETGVQTGFSREELLKKAQERYDVYHLHIMHTPAAKKAFEQWKDLMGQNAIAVDDFTKIPEMVSKIVLESVKNSGGIDTSKIKVEVKDKVETEML